MTVRYLRTRLDVLVGILILGAALTAFAQAPKFTLMVHTRRGVNGYDVNSTMISGEKDRNGDCERHPRFDAGIEEVTTPQTKATRESTRSESRNQFFRPVVVGWRQREHSLKPGPRPVL